MAKDGFLDKLIHYWRHALLLVITVAGPWLASWAQQNELLSRPLGYKSFHFESIKKDGVPTTLLEYVISNEGSTTYEFEQSLVVHVLTSDVPDLEVQGVSQDHPKPEPVEGSILTQYKVSQPRLDPGARFGMTLAISKKGWLPHDVKLRRTGKNDDLFNSMPPRDEHRAWWNMTYSFVGGVLTVIGAGGLLVLVLFQNSRRRIDPLAAHVAQICKAISEGVVSLSRATQEALQAQDLRIQSATNPLKVIEQLKEMKVLVTSLPNDSVKAAADASATTNAPSPPTAQPPAKARSGKGRGK